MDDELPRPAKWAMGAVFVVGNVVVTVLAVLAVVDGSWAEGVAWLLVGAGAVALAGIIVGTVVGMTDGG